MNDHPGADPDHSKEMRQTAEEVEKVDIARLPIHPIRGESRREFIVATPSSANGALDLTYSS
jgi:hypothetical protein